MIATSGEGSASGSTVDRRRFLATCSCGLIALAVHGCASVAARPVSVTNGIIELSLADHPSLSKRGGSLIIQPDQSDDPLYVLALDNGEYSVLSPICTHRGCTVDIAGAQLVCPCHGSIYDRRGKVLDGPAPLPLGRYAARVSDRGTLLIDVGRAR